MPVCRECARYWSPRAATTGRCPDCGGEITGPTLRSAGAAEVEVKEKLPWHLKLLAVSFCLYMGFRIFQGVEWLVHRL